MIKTYKSTANNTIITDIPNGIHYLERIFDHNIQINKTYTNH